MREREYGSQLFIVHPRTLQPIALTINVPTRPLTSTMNWRLLTDEEKAANKRGRNRRLKAQQKLKRREVMFRNLGHLLTDLDLLDPVVAPSEAFDLHYRTLQKARAIEPLIRLRLCREFQVKSGGPVCPLDSPHRIVTAAVLHRSRRSRIFSWLVPPVRDFLPSEMTFTQLMTEAEAWKKSDWLDPYKLLDRLHSFCGSWEQAADLELRLGLVSTPLHPDTVAAIAAARDFWNIWSTGSHHYTAAVEESLLQEMEGSNWACFDHRGLMELLPGMNLPRSARREFYLLQINGNVRLGDLSLVICSRAGTPLAIHPI